MNSPLHLRRSSYPAVLALVALSTAGAAQTRTPQPALTFFLGLNVTVEDVSGPQPITGASDTKVLVSTPFGPRTVPIDRLSQLHMAVDPCISPLKLKVGRFKASTTYTPETDPRRQQAEQVSVLLALEVGTQNAASSRAHQSFAQAERDLMAPNPFSNVDPVAAYQTTIASGMAELQAAQRAPEVNLMGSQLGSRANSDPGRHDAVRVEFELSAAEPIESAYALYVATIESPYDLGTTRRLLHFIELPTIGPKPQRIRIRRGGYPPGFTLVDSQLHVFRRGKEIPSNLTPKTAILSPDDAFRFLLFQHTSAHAQETMPPAILPELLPRNFGRALRDDLRDQITTLGIDPEGRVMSVNGDKGESPEALADALRDLRFLPALAAGQPVNGTLRLNVRDLLLAAIE